MTIWPKTGLSLQCFPIVPSHVGLPWDAADDYLIDTLSLNDRSSMLLMNDRHGALACFFPNAYSIISQFCAQHALQVNFAANDIVIDDRQWLTESHALPRHITDVVIKLPKSWDLLLHWLELCRQQLPPDTRYWLAGMSKHIPISWLKWLQQHSASYRQYPIERKARIMCITLGTQPVYEDQWLGYQTHDQLHLDALPGVFARHRIDIGSQFLLQHLPALHGRVVDLGCGNGLLALTSKKRYPQCDVYATDDSWQAVESCRRNALQNCLDITITQGNGLSSITIQPDWVLCNPPFHDGHKQMVDIALMMFQQAAQILASNGRLVVIANRHLPYYGILKGLFKTVETPASNAKFTLYLASMPKPKKIHEH